MQGFDVKVLWDKLTPKQKKRWLNLVRDFKRTAVPLVEVWQRFTEDSADLCDECDARMYHHVAGPVVLVCTDAKHATPSISSYKDFAVLMHELMRGYILAPDSGTSSEADWVPSEEEVAARKAHLIALIEKYEAMAKYWREPHDFGPIEIWA